jgi:hypothetical protein
MRKVVEPSGRMRVAFASQERRKLDELVLALPRQDELRWKGKGMTMSPQRSSVPPQSLGSPGRAVETAATGRRAATRRQKLSGGRGGVMGARERPWRHRMLLGPLESSGVAVLPCSCRCTELGSGA